MSDSTDGIRAEFDRIALVADEAGWNQNSHYHDFILRHLPAGCGKALDVGCGTGAFARLLAERSKSVLALDLSPEMIRRARERSTEFANIEFEVSDILAREFAHAEFDFIASVATMHHLPLASVLAQLKGALKPEGVLVILDLVEPEGFYDALRNALAYPASLGLRLLNEGRLLSPPEVRAAWAEHERFDSYLKLSEVHAVCDELLPGARLRRHLFWRYSVVWKKVVV
jgi:SAM-dependent methyltransferase